MSDRKNAKPGRTFATFLCCVLGVPTCAYILPGVVMIDVMAAVTAGVALGVAYLVLRPVLRLITLPLGCLTLGLFNTVIDVGLLYACAYLIEGFTIESVIAALFSAILINAMCGVVGGFR